MTKKHSPQKVEREKAKFDAWRKRNPSKQFKDFFAETVKARLDSGRAHPTLGSNLLFDPYKVSGQGFFTRLVKYGLKPDDVCVDYGCGTLRIGLHIINYLQPGAYWGLEIADFLLDEGRKLIGEQLLTEKKPNLRVISPQSVAEAAAAKPAMVLSSAVLLHVHPQELPEYVGNIMTLIGAQGQAVLDAKLSDDETIQYSGRSWAYAASEIAAAFAAKGGKMIVMEETDLELEEFGKKLKRCMLRIVPEGAA